MGRCLTRSPLVDERPGLRDRPYGTTQPDVSTALEMGDDDAFLLLLLLLLLVLLLLLLVLLLLLLGKGVLVVVAVVDNGVFISECEWLTADSFVSDRVGLYDIGEIPPENDMEGLFFLGIDAVTQ